MVRHSLKVHMKREQGLRRMRRVIAQGLACWLWAAFLLPVAIHSSPARNARLERISKDLSQALAQASAPGHLVRVIMQVDTSEDGPDLSADDDQLLFRPPQDAARDNELLADIASRKGRIVRAFSRLGSMVVDLPASEVRPLAAHRQVRWVSPDRTSMVMASHIETTTGAAAARGSLGGAQQLDGNGIAIAILDTGIASDHAGFLAKIGGLSRILATVDMTGSAGGTPAYDRHGHGTHVAGIAAGADLLNNAYQGIAPNANLVSVKVLGDDGTGAISAALAGLNWVLTNAPAYNIRVVNMSLGVLSPDSYQVDPLCQAVESLVSAGIVVVVSGGNLGLPPGYTVPQYGLITAPGADPAAITAGSVNTHGTDLSSDDNVNNFSSRGPTRGYTVSGTTRLYDNVAKPDILAPGNHIVSAEADGCYLVTNYPSLHQSGGPHTSYMTLSGTSMAAPVVAGASALLLQANSGLTPSLIKAIFQYTAHLISGNLYDQGAGELNVEGAVRLAQALRTDIAGLQPGDPLLAGPIPLAQSSFAGNSFGWAGFIVGGGGYILSGMALFQNYQLIYRPGILWASGYVTYNNQTNVSGVLITPGVSVTGSKNLSSSGILVFGGEALVNPITVSNGVPTAESVVLAESVTLSESVVLSESTALAETVLEAEIERVMIEGEPQ